MFADLRPGLGLYLHIPFCQTKCPYCDFNTYQGIEEQMDGFTAALAGELALWGAALGRPPAATLFFGGGTPSYLPDGALGRIMEAARRAFAVAPDAEITVEANPGDLTAARCESLLRQGVNRLSIGVQSMDNALLQLLGRRHTAAQAAAALESARQAGFSNINLDLMYGLPQQTLAQWRETLAAVTALAPEHLSLYALTLEEGTPMHRWAAEGKIPAPDPDRAADMYQQARETLAAGGYRHYEISNWAQPQRECAHNLVYWRNGPYLGVGPGAHSHLGDYRFWTQRPPRAYAAAVTQWNSDAAQASPPPGTPGDAAPPDTLPPPGARNAPTPPGIPDAALPWPQLAESELRQARTVDGWEYIDRPTAAAETMFLGLRLLDGLDLREASAIAGADLAQTYAAEISELLRQGLLHRRETTLRLAEPAYLIANQVFTRFLR